MDDSDASNTGTFNETHSVTIFAPYYAGTTSATTNRVANVRSDRASNNISGGSGTHVFTGVTVGSHVYLNLPDAIFSSPTFEVNTFPTIPLLPTTGTGTTGYSTYIFTAGGSRLTITIN